MEKKKQIAASGGSIVADRNSEKIRQYRKPLNINLGIIIFGVIFIYIIIFVFMYFTTSHVAGYEVKVGSLSISNVYQGIALRDEKVVNSEYSGYINYYAREGERVGFNDLVCTVDESGKLQELMEESSAEENVLSDSDLSEIRTQIVDYSNLFNRKQFQSVYDFKYSIQGTALKLSNANILDSINEINSGGANSLVNLCRSTQSGVVVYSTDGFETITPADVTEDMFQTETYKKQQLISNELVSSGDPIYKLTDNEDWSIIIQSDKSRAQELADEEYVKVRFLKNQYTSWAKVSVLSNQDGNTYLQLFFNNSMLTFCTDRYIDLELITEAETGLKVPNAAIVEKEFFLIPSAYITKGGNSNEDGVLKESYSEDGSVIPEFVATTIYSKDGDQYYVDDSVLKLGDNIQMPNSTERYTISKSATLIGVYNINKGYADFKQIQVLYENDEYSIIKSNTEYGLNAYDYIVLDAASVKEDDFIYE